MALQGNFSEKFLRGCFSFAPLIKSSSTHNAARAVKGFKRAVALFARNLVTKMVRSWIMINDISFEFALVGRFAAVFIWMTSEFPTNLEDHPGDRIFSQTIKLLQIIWGRPDEDCRRNFRHYRGISRSLDGVPVVQSTISSNGAKRNTRQWRSRGTQRGVNWDHDNRSVAD